MGTYVLVHGAWHGAWCWDRVVPLLTQSGHAAVAPDLPGHGKDQTPVPEVTLAGYVQRVCETVNAQAEPVILVGHSMGGVVITQAAEECPDRIKMLVYVCAYLPGNGETLADWLQRNTESRVSQNLVFAADRSYSTVRSEAARDLFYGDCSDEDAAWAQSLLGPQASAPSRAPLKLTPDKYGRLPKVYIETLRDQAIPTSLQRRMYTAVPIPKVITMDTSHSPFLSAPEALVIHLTSL